MVAGIGTKPSNKYFLLSRAEKQELGKLGRWAVWVGSRHLPCTSAAKGELEKKVLHKGHRLIADRNCDLFLFFFCFGV